MFKVLPSENYVYVHRSSSSKTFSKIKINRRTIVTGPCGSGKSTYALLSYAARFNTVLTVVPDEFAKTDLEKFIKGTGTRNITITTAIDAFKAVCDGQRYEAYWIDEVHTESSYISSLVEWVRHNGESIYYALVTATPNSDETAVGVVSCQEIQSDDVSYHNSATGIEDNSLWNPSRWNGQSKAIIFASTVSHATVISRYYKKKRLSVYRVGKTTTDISKVNNDFTNAISAVLIVEPGYGSGITSNVGLLIDTGYTVDERCDEDQYLLAAVRPLTPVERVQRRSRVGRNTSAVVIRPRTIARASTTRGDLIKMRDEYAQSALGLKTVANCTSKEDCMNVAMGSTYGVISRSSSKAFTLLKERDVYLPAKVVDMTRTNAWVDLLLATPKLPSRQVTTDVDSIFDANPNKYAYAVFHAFSDPCDVPQYQCLSTPVQRMVSVAAHLRKQTKTYPYSQLVHWINQMQVKTVPREYRSLGFSRSLYDSNLLVRGRSKKPRDAVKAYSGYTQSPTTMMDYRPGPRTLASRLHRWSCATNMRVSLVFADENVSHECEYHDWSELDAFYKSLVDTRDHRHALVNKYALNVLVKMGQPCSELSKNETFVHSNKMFIPISLVGFYVRTIDDDLVMSPLQFVTMVYVDYHGFRVERKISVVGEYDMYTPVTVMTESAVVGTRRISYMGERSDVSHIWKFAVGMRLPVVISYGFKSDINDWSTLTTKWQRVIKTREKPHLLECYLVVGVVASQSDNELRFGGHSRSFEVTGLDVVDKLSGAEGIGTMSYLSRDGKIRQYEVLVDDRYSPYNGVLSKNDYTTVGQEDMVEVYDHTNARGDVAFSSVLLGELSDKTKVYVDHVGSADVDDTMVSHDWKSTARIGEADNPGPYCCDKMNDTYIRAYNQGLSPSSPCFKKSDRKKIRDGKDEMTYGGGLLVKFILFRGKLVCRRQGQHGFYVNLDVGDMCRKCRAIRMRAYLYHNMLLAFIVVITLLSVLSHDWKVGYRIGEASNPGPDDDDNSTTAPTRDSVVQDNVQKGRVDNSTFVDESMAVLQGIAPPSIANAAITTFGSGADFSPTEIAKIQSVERQFEPGSYMLNLTHFAITSDGSGKLTGNEGAELTMANGGVKKVSWVSVFTHMRDQVGKERFTLRKYLRMKSSVMIDTYLKSPQIKALFNDGNLSSLKSRCVVFSEAIYYTSWGAPLAPPDVRTSVARYNRARNVRVNGNFVGDHTQFGTTQEHIKQGPVPSETHEFEI